MEIFCIPGSVFPLLLQSWGDYGFLDCFFRLCSLFGFVLVGPSGLISAVFLSCLHVHFQSSSFQKFSGRFSKLCSSLWVKSLF